MRLVEVHDVEAEGPEWAVNELRLRREVEAWIREAIRRQQPVPWRGGHDEGTFASSWVGYYLLTGDRECLQFLYWLRDTFLEWSRKNQYHGYYRTGEIHHQTETYNDFLGHLWRAEKTDVNVAVLEDAAHHVGNWIKGIPEWYNWEKHRFRSWWLGTCDVKDYPPYDFETCDHFRPMRMVINTYLATGNERYLELARDYSDRWCKLILESKEAMPTVLYPTEDPEEITRLYGQYLSGDRTRIISFKEELPRYLAGGLLDTLLDLYALTGEKRYIEASVKALDQLCVLFGQPPTIVERYRNLTGDNRYDEMVMNSIRMFGEKSLPTILMIEGEGVEQVRTRYAYRAEDGTVKEHSGSSSHHLLLGYHISGDEKLLNKAMMLAQRRLMLARSFIRDGREHGCDGRYLHGAGAEAAFVLCSATLGWYSLCGSYLPQVQYFRERRMPGLSGGVAALLEPTSRDEKSILLYNSLDKDEVIGIRVMEEGARIKSLSIDGVSSKDFAGNETTVTARSKRVTKVRIILR